MVAGDEGFSRWSSFAMTLRKSMSDTGFRAGSGYAGETRC